MGACRVTISHLLPPTTLKPKTGDSKLQKGNPKTLKTSKPAPSSVNRRLLLLSLPSYAAILANTSQSNSCFALTTYDPISPVEKDASLSISQRIAEAIRLLDRGRELQAEGDFNGALGYFTQVLISHFTHSTYFIPVIMISLFRINFFIRMYCTKGTLLLMAFVLLHFSTFESRKELIITCLWNHLLLLWLLCAFVSWSLLEHFNSCNCTRENIRTEQLVIVWRD